MYSDPEQRELEIKNLSSVYKVLADEILPQLRRSRLILNYEIIGKSDEELSTLAQTAGSQLDIEELLYAATLTQDNAQKEAIYNRVIQQYPDDYRAYNNLGSVYYQASNIAQAESLYKKAESIKAAPEVNLNLGLVALVKGDNVAAESYFSKASGSEYLNEALGNLYISQGQYERAVSSFGNSKTNSAALAQILAKDYNSAKSTLESIATPNAITDYLNAILGARTNNTSLLVSSLKSAVQKDASLSQKAASDIEFNRYRTIPEFQEVVK
jgi:tetratricopeptide (TPR) repeat protein